RVRCGEERARGVDRAGRCAKGIATGLERLLAAIDPGRFHVLEETRHRLRRADEHRVECAFLEGVQLVGRQEVAVTDDEEIRVGGNRRGDRADHLHLRAVVAKDLGDRHRAVRVGVLGVPLHAAHVRRRADDRRAEGEQENARTDDDERRAPRGRTGGSGGGRGAHAGSIARAGWASWRSRSRSRSTMYWAWVAGWFPYRASLKERAPRCSGSLRWGKT